MMERVRRSTEELPERAGVDFATFYAAGDFLKHRQPVEPWAEESFKTLVDVAVNHPNLVYPHATPKGTASDKPENLPDLLNSFRRSEIISPVTGSTAEQYKHSAHEIKYHYRQFRAFARDDRRHLASFIAFHLSSEVRGYHERLMETPQFVQAETLSHWHAELGGPRLARELCLDSNGLMMAFDAFYRGRQYYELLASEGICYFPHVLRCKVFDDRFVLHRELDRLWSWGNLLAGLVKAQEISRTPDEVADIVRRTRNEVDSLGLRYCPLDSSGGIDKDTRERIETVAAQVGLPAHAKRSTTNILKALIAGSGAVVDSLCGTYGLATVLLSIGAAVLDNAEVTIPGRIAGFPLLRGAVTWPGLFREGVAHT